MTQPPVVTNKHIREMNDGVIYKLCKLVELT